MKTKLKKGLKRRLRRLAKTYGVEEATAAVTSFLGGLGGSKAAGDEYEDEIGREPAPVAAAPAPPPEPIYPPYPPPEPGHPEQHH